MANSKVLFNPIQSPEVIESSNHVGAEVHEFHELLGIESGSESSEAREWQEAAEESWDAATDVGAQGVATVKQFGSKLAAGSGSGRRGPNLQPYRHRRPCWHHQPRRRPGPQTLTADTNSAIGTGPPGPNT